MNVQRLPIDTAENHELFSLDQRATALVISINQREESLGDDRVAMVKKGWKQGAELLELESITGLSLDKLKEYFPRIGRTQLYNYRNFSQANPGFLEKIQSAGQAVLSLSQEIVLLNAPEEIRQDVVARVENGETITVKEIEKLKRENKKLTQDKDALQQENSQLFDEKEQLSAKVVREQIINQKLKTNSGIDDLIKVSLDEEKNRLEAELNQLVSEHERDYQNRIDELNDKLSKAKNDLVKASGNEEMSAIQQQINDARSELNRINQRRLEADADAAYRKLAKTIIEWSATAQTALIELTGKTAFYAPTSELLLRAAHDIDGIADKLRTAAQYEQFDFNIEG